MLYYNSITLFGYPWLNDDEKNPMPSDYSKGYLVKYKMIKNIALPMVDFGISPKDMLLKTIETMQRNNKDWKLFEWDEIEERKFPKQDKFL